MKTAKTVNLLIHWLVLTPLTAISSCAAICLIVFLADFGNSMESLGLFGMLFMAILCFGVCFLIAKVVLRLKGKTVSYTYYDDTFEYELRRRYDDSYDVVKTRGGWTSSTTGIVWLYLFFSPVLFLFQLVANFFAFLTFFKPRIVSFYGELDCSMLPAPTLQSIIHFFFNFIILPKDMLS